MHLIGVRVTPPTAPEQALGYKELLKRVCARGPEEANTSALFEGQMSNFGYKGIKVQSTKFNPLTNH